MNQLIMILDGLNILKIYQMIEYGLFVSLRFLNLRLRPNIVTINRFAIWLSYIARAISVAKV